MLTRLHIRNFAIIDSLDINFSEHLNIITGETGAGKSILMGALGLILGDRAESAVLPGDGRKCVVEGFFSQPEDDTVKLFFAANDLDADKEIVLRREISSAGKSRGFINDTPVNLSQMKELCQYLVDLHQQFDTQDLDDTHFQRSVLDALAGNAALLPQLKDTYEGWQRVAKALNELKTAQEAASREADYNRFLFEELEKLSLSPGELENIDAELKLLNNAESVKSQLGEVSYVLSGSEQPLVQQIKVVEQKLGHLREFHPAIESLKERLSSSVIELADIASEIEHLSDSVVYDAERIQILNDRLAEGYRLQKKHGVQDTQGLLDRQAELSEALSRLVNDSVKIEELEKEAIERKGKAMLLASTISANRKKQVDGFVKKVNALLKQVGMPNARIRVDVSEGELEIHGIDKVAFLFNANVPEGETGKTRFEPLGKVASGGERSRLMLSIKHLVAKKLQLPTLIFDEIDSGISGEAAKQVGNIMKELSLNHQIISITHQAQVAARADAHYFVFKEMKQQQIYTSVKELNREERVNAIARMLSGEKPTAAALENAREMVEEG